MSRNEGFIVITGEIGAGKTMMLRALIEGLHGSNVVTGHLVTTQLDAEDTLRMVGAAFGFQRQGRAQVRAAGHARGLPASARPARASAAC